MLGYISMLLAVAGAVFAWRDKWKESAVCYAVALLCESVNNMIRRYWARVTSEEMRKKCGGG